VIAPDWMETSLSLRPSLGVSGALESAAAPGTGGRNLASKFCDRPNVSVWLAALRRVPTRPSREMARAYSSGTVAAGA
jgi:hypothetical protein